MVAKRQGRGKPTKIEQRKVGGSSEDPQVEETALLASPIYKGQAQGEEEKNIKRGAKGPGVSHSCSLISLSPSPSLCLSLSSLCFNVHSGRFAELGSCCAQPPPCGGPCQGCFSQVKP